MTAVAAAALLLSIGGMRILLSARVARPLPSSRTLGVWFVLALVTGLLPADLHAHQRLLRTEPARDAVADTVPREVRLVFNEPVQLGFTRIELVGPDGAAVPTGELRVAADAATVLVVPLPGPLRAGTYTVRWATASADGHPVRGEFGFAIAPDAAGLVPEPAAEPDAVPPAEAPIAPPPATEPGTPFSAESPVYVAVRWLLYVGMLGVLGAVSFGIVVLGMARRRERAAEPDLIEAARRRAASVGLVFAALLGVAALARLHAQSVALHGAGAALDPLRLGGLLTTTLWGWGWLLQVVGVAVAAFGFAAARRDVGAGWGLAGLGALALAVTPALSGHAAAVPGWWGIAAVAADALHVLAAGAWLGALLVLLLAGLPAAAGRGPARRGAAVAALIRAFSPTALGFATVLVVTGVFASLLHLGSPGDLVASDYGRLLLAKLGVFLLVAAAGAYHFLRVRPAPGGDDTTARFRTSAGIELALGAIVLLLTAVLVATPPPP